MTRQKRAIVLDTQSTLNNLSCEPEQKVQGDQIYLFYQFKNAHTANIVCEILNLNEVRVKSKLIIQLLKTKLYTGWPFHDVSGVKSIFYN